jgi:anti-sigma regulatory factor (Ser/Thr protein kinase)
VIVRQTFTKNISSLQAITRALEEFSLAHGLTKLSHTRLTLVVEELFTNMVKYSQGVGTTVDIQLDISADRLKIQLTEPDVDEFNPFVTATNLSIAPLDSTKPGGRGIFLVKEIAEEVSYQYANRQGTTTVVIKTGDNDV